MRVLEPFKKTTGLKLEDMTLDVQFMVIANIACKGYLRKDACRRLIQFFLH